MASRQVLIDGYNVIGADPMLAGLRDSCLEAARSALIKAVAASPRFLGDQVTIVFDGGAARSFLSSQRHGHITAVFSNGGMSADDVIKARVAGNADARNVIVVTNDRDVAGVCAGYGCTVTRSENLLEQLSTPRKMPRKARGSDGDDYAHPTLSTVKKGNPKRLPKAMRNRKEYTF